MRARLAESWRNRRQSETALLRVFSGCFCLSGRYVGQKTVRKVEGKLYFRLWVKNEKEWAVGRVVSTGLAPRT